MCVYSSPSSSFVVFDGGVCVGITASSPSGLLYCTSFSTGAADGWAKTIVIIFSSFVWNAWSKADFPNSFLSNTSISTCLSNNSFITSTCLFNIAQSIK